MEQQDEGIRQSKTIDDERHAPLIAQPPGSLASISEQEIRPYRQHQEETYHEDDWERAPFNRKFILIALIVMLLVFCGFVYAEHTAEFISTSILAVVIALIGLNQYHVTKKQWFTSNNQAEVASKALEQSRELFIISERAYIGLDEVVPVTEIRTDQPLTLLVNLENAGKTPAEHLEVIYAHGRGLGWKEDDTKIEFEEISKPIIVVYALPGKISIIIRKEPIDAEKLKSIAWGMLVWFIKVDLRYLDFHKTIQTHTFFVMFQPDEDSFRWDSLLPLSGKFNGIHLPDETYIEKKNE